MHVGDLMDRDFIKSVLKGAKYVYHFAGIADISEAIDKPYATVESNVMGTSTALDAAVNADVERFIYASTMYVYSSYGSFYRASKQAAEIVIEAYSEKYDLSHTLLRYGSLYGPRSQTWNGLKRYVKEIVENSKLIYPGGGEEKREYIHVKDAARLSVDVLDDSHKNQAITVTGVQVLKSKELIEMIFEIAGIIPDVTFDDSDRQRHHYVTTPYRYTPKQAKKLIPNEFIDLGEGILELVDELYRESKNSR
jgi:UDP-glucose 4-epimerase